MTREFAGVVACMIGFSTVMGWASEGFETNVVYVVGTATIIWGAIVGAGFIVQARLDARKSKKDLRQGEGKQ